MGSIKGIIRDNNNRPVPDVTVMIVSGPSHPDIAPMSDENGNFDLSNLAAGEYRIKAYGNVESENIPVTVYHKKTAFVEIWLDIGAYNNGDQDKLDIYPTYSNGSGSSSGRNNEIDEFGR
jgi:hypothetical protein